MTLMDISWEYHGHIMVTMGANGHIMGVSCEYHGNIMEIIIMGNDFGRIITHISGISWGI